MLHHSIVKLCSPMQLVVLGIAFEVSAALVSQTLLHL